MNKSQDRENIVYVSIINYEHFIVGKKLFFVISTFFKSWKIMVIIDIWIVYKIVSWNMKEKKY